LDRGEKLEGVTITKPKDLLPPIARDILSRASGSYALWSVLVTSNYLDGRWNQTDWLDHLLVQKAGVWDKLKLPIFSADHLRAKYQLAVPVVPVLFEIAIAYENKLYGFVLDAARENRRQHAMREEDNYLEWFERASAAKSPAPSNGKTTAAIEESVASVRQRLAEEDIVIVHRVFAAVTEMTFTE